MRREHWLYIGFGIILVLLVFTFVYNRGSYWGPCGGQSFRGRGPHGMHHEESEFFGIGFYGFGLLFWVLVGFFLLLIFLSTSKEKAIDILDKRYAQGDISKEEYTVMKEDLTQ
ncbi:MAG: SHOCT domain-containing protein [Candidatus Methanofastidiosia archaeon]|jgi:uncharacterized membrane protein